MRLLQPFLVTLSILSAQVLAEDAPRVKHDYQVGVSAIPVAIVDC